MRNLLYFQTSIFADVPRWVGISREALLHSARAVNQHLKVTAMDRWLIAQPLSRIGSFAILARCHDSGASHFHLDGDWDPGRFVDCCKRDRITLVSLAPAQLYDVVKHGLKAPPDLRAVVVGGGGILAKHSSGKGAISLGWPLLHSYGITEACSLIAAEPLKHLGGGFDPDVLEVLQGWNLESDRNGLLYVRGRALASGCARKRDWRKRKWIAEDVKLSMSSADKGHPLWLWEPIDPASGVMTCDHVELWSHGPHDFLRYLAHGSSFVKVLGELVNLSVLHPRLEGLAIAAGMGFGNVVILPMQDDRMGSRLLLVGQSPPQELERLRDRFNRQVAAHEKLDQSIQVATLPRDEMDKLDMVALKELVHRVLAE
jgi:O-succinylbenzoic acid--CoA ligase